jgi:hypothetical protein
VGTIAASVLLAGCVAVTFLVVLPLYVTQYFAGHNHNCHAEILAVMVTLFIQV